MLFYFSLQIRQYIHSCFCLFLFLSLSLSPPHKQTHIQYSFLSYIEKHSWIWKLKCHCWSAIITFRVAILFSFSISLSLRLSVRLPSFFPPLPLQAGSADMDLVFLSPRQHSVHSAWSGHGHSCIFCALRSSLLLGGEAKTATWKLYSHAYLAAGLR